MDPRKNYYQILHVSEEADAQVIAAAYRALAKKYHPDLVGSAAAEQMQMINEAYKVLQNTASRSEYDRIRNRSADFEAGRRADAPDDADTAQEWKLILELYPEIETSRSDLARLSAALANTFRLQIIGSKEFSKHTHIAKEIRTSYLCRYFGYNLETQNLGEAFVLRSDRESAKKLNELVSVFGRKLTEDELTRVLSKFNVRNDSRTNAHDDSLRRQRLWRDSLASQR